MHVYEIDESLLGLASLGKFDHMGATMAAIGASEAKVKAVRAQVDSLVRTANGFMVGVPPSGEGRAELQEVLDKAGEMRATLDAAQSVMDMQKRGQQTGKDTGYGGREADRVAAEIPQALAEARAASSAAASAKRLREQEDYARKQYEGQQESERLAKEKAELRAQELEDRRIQIEQARAERMAALEEQRFQAQSQAEMARVNAEIAAQQQSQAMQYQAEQARLQADLAARNPQATTHIYNEWGVPVPQQTLVPIWGGPDPYVTPPFFDAGPGPQTFHAQPEAVASGDWFLDDAGGGFFGLGALVDTLNPTLRAGSKIEQGYKLHGNPQDGYQIETPTGAFERVDTGNVLTSGASVILNGKRVFVAGSGPIGQGQPASSGIDWSSIAKGITDVFAAVTPSALQITEAATGRRFMAPAQEPRMVESGFGDTLVKAGAVAAAGYVAWKLLGGKKRGGRR